MRVRRYLPLLLAALLSGLLTGCMGGRSLEDAGESTFVFGDTTFNAEHEEADIHPHHGYSGWACIRYGVGETLFRCSDSMELEPWLAESWELEDERTWKITLRDGITFSSGRPLDGQAVKACLEQLVQEHERAQNDLDIESIAADGQTVTIVTAEPRPALLSCLCDPYSCVVDLEAGGAEAGIVAGTGPYRAVSLESGEKLELVKNENYWNGEPGFDRVTVLNIDDGDTLTMALQAGEIDGAYGLPYASYPLFENEDYTFSSCATSRTFFLHMNFSSSVTADAAVRQAIAMGVNKERFVQELLDGCGYMAKGPFPDTFSFGGGAEARTYDPEAAAKLLEEAGWKDTDGDGIREKDGQKLVIRWLTYPSRPELPLLAEAAQSDLKAIGMDVRIESTPDHNRLRQDPEAWDVYASAMVTAPAADPAYFFEANCLKDSPANDGSYWNPRLEELADEMSRTFDRQRREELAGQMQQILLDDDAFVFCSHLQMSLITRSEVTGLTAHPCDYYEITADVRPAE